MTDQIFIINRIIDLFNTKKIFSNHVLQNPTLNV